MRLSRTTGRKSGFTRVECAATAIGLFLLLGVAIATFANSREPGNRAVCVNHLRQLGLAAQMFSSENSGLFPPRNGTNFWPTYLQPYYRDLGVLVCPSDGPQKLPPWPSIDSGPRSYILNGWDDYWREKGVSIDLGIDDAAMPLADVPQPSQTLLFGEKESESHQMHVDIFESEERSIIDHSKHFRTPASISLPSGGSNFAFVDGSVRFISGHASFDPVNLWAVTDQWRTNTFGF